MFAVDARGLEKMERSDCFGKSRLGLAIPCVLSLAQLKLALAGHEAMMRWARGRYAIEMIEPVYSFGSADNARSYEHEFLLESDYRPSSKHALRCFLDDGPCGSAVLGASGVGVRESTSTPACFWRIVALLR